MKSKKCEHLNKVGKCRLKVPTRYNDYCDKNDCPLKYKQEINKLKQ